MASPIRNIAVVDMDGVIIGEVRRTRGPAPWKWRAPIGFVSRPAKWIREDSLREAFEAMMDELSEFLEP